jgi:Phasin protein
MATQETRAAPAGDLHKLILVRQAWIDDCQAINAEMLASWQSRLKAGLAVGGQLLECTSVDSALEVQLDYVKGALQAYLDQSARINGLVVRALSAGVVEPAVPQSPGATRALAA